MSLKQQLTEDMKTAMRARDAVRLGVIRFLLSEVKNVEIDHGDQNDNQIQKIIASQIKKMKDAMIDFTRGARQDLVDSEQAKIDILEKYLPSQLSDEQLTEIISEVIAQSPVKQSGPIIGQTMKKVAGQADGGRVAALVQSLLK